MIWILSTPTLMHECGGQVGLFDSKTDSFKSVFDIGVYLQHRSNLFYQKNLTLEIDFYLVIQVVIRLWPK